ncbi:MAG: hypothetical protein QME52_13180 [Bacteroidota bacterium]|nr:hypothetical protein [Bacteroidota bacterium]
MKSIIGILLLFILYFIKVNAQGYYPLQVGNLWQYTDVFNQLNGWRVTRDSLDSDGSRYIFGIDYSTYPTAEYLRYKIDIR